MITVDANHTAEPENRRSGASVHVGPGGIDLSGFHIVVHGAAGTLAGHFVRAAAAAGAALSLVDTPGASSDTEDRNRSNLQSLGDACRGISGEDPLLFLSDISDATDTVTLFEHIRAARETVDIAVNFAGVHHAPFDLLADDIQELAATFRTVTEINLVGAFLFTTAAARVMIPRRTGHIIHLCSNGSRAALYGSYAYNASKHGVEGVVRTAAAQLAPVGVRVNGIAPGTVVTNLNRHMLFDEAGELRSRAKSILSHTPTKRFATPEGIAESLLAMCVPQRHLTGNVVFADDGYSIEGHTWPAGNEALYTGTDALAALLDQTDGPA
ncbi:MAG: SDR family NAD(P)-dependent oxidoreductase [Spirochaeta sp.]|jgi:NAD(P)-dependent dehydrogenase (short-subunit alcohol dehydrogenase family)|nr:SDR family NAD(P)-dependent oxidoreductase [Spirochaeta sp.]